jgi:aspartate/tyrosine/aromatic aminotransferase
MPFGRIAKDKNMFDRLPQFTADPILALIGRYAADKRSQKIDLGVGVYKNEAGETPVLKAVKAAEAIILRDEKTKTYLGASGNLDYSKHLKALVLWAAPARCAWRRICWPRWSRAARCGSARRPGRTISPFSRPPG